MSEPRRIKSASDLKSSTGRIDARATAHKMYLRIASLESKRQRYEREQEFAAMRIKECSERCARITEEVQSLLAEIRNRFPSAEVSISTRRVIPSKTQSSIRGSSVTHRY